MSRRRRPRNDRTMEVASEQHMTRTAEARAQEAEAHGRGRAEADLIRQQAEEYTPAPMTDAKVDAEVEARDDAADEIAAGMADLEEEDADDDAGPHPEPIVQPAIEIPETRDETDLEEVAREVWTPLGDHEKQNVVNFVDEWPNPVELEPVIDPEIFERGPLAASIRIFEAMLTQAKAGYIEAQVDEFERVTEESFTVDEREFLATVAAQEKTVTGLPDVAGAYRALVGIKARAAA